MIPKYPGLRAAMARQGLTAADLAEILQITKTCLYMKLNCKTDFKINEVEKLCKFFNADYYELFTNSDKTEYLEQNEII